MNNSHATARIHSLEAERKKRQDDVKRKKGRIAAASNEALNSASGNNFASRSDTVEDLLKSDTVGLVTHEDFIARRKYLERCAADEREKRQAARRDLEAESRRLRLKKANKAVLSFGGDEESEDDDSDGEVKQERTKARKAVRADDARRDVAPDADDSQNAREPPPKRNRVRKNPDADTKFLPDRDREIAEQVERERLKQAWINEQEAIKKQIVSITYSYWDGSGHRRVMRCEKGTTVGRFLGMVQTQFKELRSTSADALMFIKEDLIIPHHYSFYDFIVTKARGVSAHQHAKANPSNCEFLREYMRADIANVTLYRPYAS